MPDLSSGRRTAATALLDAMGDPGKVVDRGTILPLGTYEDGSTGLAWPSVLYDPVKSVGRLWDNAPAAADPSASPEVMSQTGEDLFNIAGAVSLGGFAAPKPAGALGMSGGRVAGDALPMDQASRLARAREMGFDTDNVLYHGTHPSNVGPGGETRYRAADFESFDSGFLGDNSGLTPGFSFSSSPENASGYAGLNSIVEWNKEFNSKLAAAYDKAYGKKRLSKDQRTLAIRDHADLVKKAHESDMNDPSIATWKDTQIEGGAVYPVHVRHGRQMVIDAEGALWKNINGTRVQELAKKAKEDGYDSLVVKNVRDAGNARQASQGLLSDTTIVFDSKNIRSVNAAFDPAMSDSANLLAANGRNSSLPYLTGQAQEEPEPIDINELLRRNGLL